jgi:Kef-type K+ transport system membrane component KefB
MMFALLIGYGTVANEIGSHLLGAFIAGMSFCWMEPALMLWHSQVKRIANWLIRLFFGATVAFSIPINIMMDLDALWKGMILGAGPCCLTKIISGITTGADKFVVGFAMVGRGEFAYLVAQTAQDTLLNPAPASFDGTTAGHHLVEMPGGYWCVDGECTDSAAPAAEDGGRRQLAPSGDDSVGGAVRWCGHEGHESPVRGHKYWQAGKVCAEHEADCDCDMMMPASAFSICVWALVMASILAPTGFGVFLNRRMEKEKEQAALERSQRSMAAIAHKAQA